ncbi:hypothetical protein [Brevundimonas variabilis]|uniref:Lipoprotein n=1 Tax=Brevundimonas variabilis TaxID=74312 RepID=A0A7W9CK31_9CAUL|nr:hypothetical protein [Brevundimonas variabilis]MBB5747140.1 hypothetical protein [Brevundimonas variabilis]
MKATSLALAASVLALSACAPGLQATPEAYAATDTVFEGWLRFSGEEFQLNARQDQVLQPLARPCLSGALPRDLQRQARQDLNGQRVRITGQNRAWSDDLPGRRIDQQGSNIRNECGAAFVILADRIVPIA